MRAHQQIAFVFVTLLTVVSAAAQSPSLERNWPQWRGPLGTGVAPHGDPPLTWNDTTNIRWKVRIPGDGTSTPIVWGDQIFILTAVPARGESTLPSFNPEPKATAGTAKTGGLGKGNFGKAGRGGFGGSPPPTEPYRFILLSIDRKTGQTQWQRVCREEIPHEGFRVGDGSYAASSAITDGEQVYAFFGSRGLYCFDLAGSLKWEKDFGDQRTRNGFGEGATPALYGNTIVVPWDHEDEDFIVALDKRTGSEMWRQQRDEPTGWSTPLVVDHGGQTQVVLGGTNRVRSYDLTTGRQIWECEGLTTNVIPTAVTKDGIVYITSGYQGYKLLAIRLGSTGDLTGTSAIVWRIDRDTPYVASPLLSGDRLYVFRSRDTILSCVDAKTGKPHYSAQRIGELGANVYASPVAAAGRVYLVGRNGTCVVLQDADRYEVLATNVLNDPIDASPAIVGKELFLRSRENLYCISGP